MCVPSLTCSDVTNSMVEDWKTSCHHGKCPSQVGYVYDGPMYGQLVLTDCLEVVSKTGQQIFQDSNSVGQDGKWN